MLPFRSRILAGEISTASTSLQQRQSISLNWFLQCPNLHQLRFPILTCNKPAAEREYVQFLPPGSHYHKFFSVRTQTEIVEEWWNETFHFHLYFHRNNLFLHQNINLKSQFQYFSVGQNLKERRNRNLRTILVRSLFCLVRRYLGLRFLRFLLENQFLVFLCFL